MIRIIEGTPGSGKTFYALKLLTTITNYDFELNLVKNDIKIYTNIEGLKIDHYSFDDLYKNTKFEYEKVKEKVGSGRILFLIDEAQRYFYDPKPETLFTFEYHRHHGWDIILIVQSRSALKKRIIDLAEYVISAKPRSIKKVTRGFEFEMIDAFTNKKLQDLYVKTDNRIFALYKSFQADEFIKPKNFVSKKMTVGLVVAVLCLVLSFAMMKTGFFFRDKTTKNNNAVHGVQADKEKQAPTMNSIVKAPKNLELKKNEVINTSNNENIDINKLKETINKEIKTNTETKTNENEQNNNNNEVRYKMITVNKNDVNYKMINVDGIKIKGKMMYNDKVYLFYE